MSAFSPRNEAFFGLACFRQMEAFRCKGLPKQDFRKEDMEEPFLSDYLGLHEHRYDIL